ncbi:MAG TPA: hypothetical protein VFD89_05565 [Clostridia bacterium]|nr:hypothetical protein [Clostridia bacterium]
MDRYIPLRYSSNINPKINPGNTIDLPKDADKRSGTQKKMPPGFTYAPPAQANPLPIILLILLVSPYIQRARSDSIRLYNSEESQADGSDTVVDILTSIYPYLDPKHQDGINFIVGLAKTKANLQGLIDGTYQTPRISGASKPITSYKERAVGIIKALQPHISLENQTQINRILHVNNTLEKLVDSIERFKERNSIKAQDSAADKISRAMEMIDILKILAPAEQLQYIDQVSNVLRLVGTIELAQQITPSIQDSSRVMDGAGAVDGKEQGQSFDDSGATRDATKERDEKVENISKAFKSVLNPDQAKSLELIMNMAQLLSKDSSDKNGAD